MALVRPLVSVVTATYGGDEPAFLAQALDSVIASHHRPLQYLVACDGPLPPGSRDVLQERTRAHPWIEVLDLAGPRGPAATRNAALQRCRGDYVAVLDADDVMLPDRIPQQIAFLTEHDLDVVASQLAVIDADGGVDSVRRFPVEPAAVRARMPYYCATANPAVLVRAAILNRFRYPDLPVGEDYRLWVELLRGGCRIGNVPAPLTQYRTGSAYFGRRRGLAYARTDLATKLRALPLAPWWQAPLVVAVAAGSFGVRLLPAGVFRGAYAAFERVTRR